MEAVRWKGEKGEEEREEARRVGARGGKRTIHPGVGSRSSGSAKRIVATSLGQAGGHADEVTARGRGKHTPKAHTPVSTWQGVRAPRLSLSVS